MKLGSGALLVGVGLFVIWLGVTGRLANLGAALHVLTAGSSGTGNAASGTALPTGAVSAPLGATPPLALGGTWGGLTPGTAPHLDPLPTLVS